MSSGHIFDIMRYSLHDGPGIRTTIFFSGCSCSCSWCHNPESQPMKGRLEYYPSRCIACAACNKACGNNAISLTPTGIEIDYSSCSACGKCIHTCYAEALVLKGRQYTVTEVMRQILADRSYYEESGGGVTLSGGEPLLQQEFALELLCACKEEGLHTVLQTAGNYSFDLLLPLLPYLDMVMYDLKAISPDIYSAHIHGDREQMLANLVQLDSITSGNLIVRTPCIGSVNDNQTEMEKILSFLQSMKNLHYFQLIPYHSLAKVKYLALGLGFEDTFYAPKAEVIESLQDIMRGKIPLFSYRDGVTI